MTAIKNILENDFELEGKVNRDRVVNGWANYLEFSIPKKGVEGFGCFKTNDKDKDYVKINLNCGEGEWKSISVYIDAEDKVKIESIKNAIIEDMSKRDYIIDRIKTNIKRTSFEAAREMAIKNLADEEYTSLIERKILSESFEQIYAAIKNFNIFTRSEIDDLKDRDIDIIVGSVIRHLI